jgi:hypothetical protein
MGILLPNNKFWAHAGWVSREFFDDCLELIGDDATFSDIKEEIEDTVKFHVFTLSYENIERSKLVRLQKLVDRIILLNNDRGDQHFNDPKWFPGYMEKLEKLRSVLIEVEKQMS